MFGLFYTAYNTKYYYDVDVEYKIYGEVELQGKYHYIYSIKGDTFKTISYDKPMIFENDIIIMKEYSQVFEVCSIFGYIILFLYVIFIIISLVVDDDDHKWQIKGPLEDAFRSLIRCEIDRGVYFYTVFDKLIAKSDNICYYFSIRSFEELRSCPTFKTKSRLRDEFLDKLLK